MDKEEEKTVEVKPSPTVSSSSINSSRTQTDDESITTSTESEAFEETWTLVTEKTNQQIPVAAEALHLDQTKGDQEGETEAGKAKSGEQQVKIKAPTQPQEEEEGDENIDSDKDQNGRKSDHDNTADDELSDGISIISESESAGRSSPNLSGDRLTNLNIKLTLGENSVMEEDTAAIPRAKLNYPIKMTPSGLQPVIDETDSQSQLTHRRRRRSGSHSSNSEKNKKALKPLTVMAALKKTVPVVAKRTFTITFYVLLITALIGFLGKIKMMIFGVPPSLTSAVEEKLNDIEMQNNLMRAEIDLLTKQVTYLNNLKQQQQPAQQQQAPKYKGEASRMPYHGYNEAKQMHQNSKEKEKEKPNSFKAWTGHDETLKPVEITKKDLKRPFKCNDGRYVEVAGMCMENRRRKNEKVINPLGSLMDDLFDEAGNLKNMISLSDGLREGGMESILDFTSQPPAPPSPPPPSAKTVPSPPPMQRQENDGKASFEAAPQPNGKPKDFNRKYENSHKHNYKNKEYQQKQGVKDSDEDKDYKGKNKPNYKYDNSDEDFNKSKYNKNMNQKDDSKEKRFDSNEQTYRKNNKNNSKERFDRKNSKERYDSRENKRPKYNSGENRRHYPKDSDWHEQYMHQREQARQQQNSKEKDNWYIERGGSRERLRY